VCFGSKRSHGSLCENHMGSAGRVYRQQEDPRAKQTEITMDEVEQLEFASEDRRDSDKSLEEILADFEKEKALEIRNKYCSFVNSRGTLYPKAPRPLIRARSNSMPSLLIPPAVSTRRLRKTDSFA
jgi:hypothetical protein